MTAQICRTLQKAFWAPGLRHSSTGKPLVNIYLNSAATTWPKPASVQSAVTDALMSACNPGRTAEKVQDPIERARLNIASFLQAKDPNTLAFVPSATWAANCAIQSLPWQPGDHVIISGLEHNACSRPVRIIAARHDITFGCAPYAPGNPMDLDWVEGELRQRKVKLVVANMGSNVTGELTPYAQLRELTRKYGARLMLDATQVAGVLPLDLSEIDPDMAVFAGHKGLHGPPGIGMIYLSPDLPTEVFVGGGTGKDSGALDMSNSMPSKFEVGTPNLPGILGLEAGVAWVQSQGTAQIFRHESNLAAHFVDGLSKLENVLIYGGGTMTTRLPVISVNFLGRDPKHVAKWLSKGGVVTRAGFHCSPLAHQSIGSHPWGGTVRFSFGYHNTLAEVQYALHLIEVMLQVKAKETDDLSFLSSDLAGPSLLAALHLAGDAQRFEHDPGI